MSGYFFLKLLLILIYDTTKVVHLAVLSQIFNLKNIMLILDHNHNKQYQYKNYNNHRTMYLYIKIVVYFISFNLLK